MLAASHAVAGLFQGCVSIEVHSDEISVIYEAPVRLVERLESQGQRPANVLGQ